MICALVEILIDLYALGRLVSFETRLVESHLASCAECAEKTARWKQTLQSLKSLPAPTAPPGLKAALKIALTAAAASTPSPVSEFIGDWRPVRIPSMAMAFGCAALLLSVSLSIFSPGPASQSCSDSPSSVCLAPFASQSAIRINP